MSTPSISVAVAVVHKNGLWLVAKRHPHVHLGGKWEFPGGKSEPGETAEQTALRELEEECAVHAAIDHKLDTLRCDYGDRIVHLTPVICHWRSGQPKPIACAETAWVTLEQLARLDMPALNASILQALARIFHTACENNERERRFVRLYGC